MLFDTGTNTTILTPSVGARVGLTRGRDAELESLNGSARGIAGEARGIGFRDIPVGAVRTAIVTEIPGLPGFGGSLGGLYGHNWTSGAEYVIDYRAKHLVMGPAGTLPLATDGQQVPLWWSEGRPTVTATVRARTIESFSAWLVLDSGADHVTLFGSAAKRVTLAADSNQTMTIDSGFGAREVPSAAISVNLAGVDKTVSAELRPDLNREEDGLIPTSFFRSVRVSAAEGVVVFNTSLSVSGKSGSQRDRCHAAPAPSSPLRQ